MTDQATPNLPSRDFDSTAAFYERLGFGIVFRDAGWMILQRGDLMLEFFAHPTCLLQLIMVTNKAIASQISQIKHFFHCILVVVCPNSSMYLIMSGSRPRSVESLA
ncbi:hypothetical protein BVK87_31485 [Achromobacter denitrificans]|nr:hypothetical protein BVK87_31485 [Achromobacter denitrificans]